MKAIVGLLFAIFLVPLLSSCDKGSPLGPDPVQTPVPSLRQPQSILGPIEPGKENTVKIGSLQKDVTMDIVFNYEPKPPDAIISIYVFKSMDDWHSCFYGNRVCNFVASSSGDNEPQTLKFTNEVEWQDYFVTVHNKGLAMAAGSGGVRFLPPVN